MPPRKKARTSPTHQPTATSPTPTLQSKTTTPTSPNPALLDPWTDEEESALFKGLIKWKPTGIHKHFRLLQLRTFLIQHGYIHPLAAHTSLPGLWRKLTELYDLEALDQREDARQLSDYSEEVEGEEGEDEEDDVYSVASNKIHKEPFTLPEEDYGQEMWERRLPEREEREEESPPEMREVNLMEEAPVQFTPSFSVEPSELAETPVEQSKRGRGRPRGSGSGRGGAVAAAQAAGTRRSKRQVEESAGDEEEEEGSSGEESGEESSEEEEESEESTPAPRAGRAGRGRGRGGRGGAGRGRGRKR